MKRIFCAILLVTLLLGGAWQAFAGAEPYLGEISIFAGNYAPRGYAFCDGQVLKIADNAALFSLLGPTYGGDGKSTFALPDLKEAEKGLQGARYIIAVEGIYPSRQ